jgi:hypothetical protein
MVYIDPKVAAKTRAARAAAYGKAPVKPVVPNKVQAAKAMAKIAKVSK